MKVHMSLPAKNLQDTIQFYTALFGEGPAKVKSDYVKFDPKTISLNISFHLISSNDEINTSPHLGVEISDQKQIDQVYNRLKKEGIVTEKKTQSICCYANQDKFWVKDPTGFKWEVYRLLADSDLKQQESDKCCAGDKIGNTKSCCA